MMVSARHDPSARVGRRHVLLKRHRKRRATNPPNWATAAPSPGASALGLSVFLGRPLANQRSELRLDLAVQRPQLALDAGGGIARSVRELPPRIERLLASLEERPDVRVRFVGFSEHVGEERGVRFLELRQIVCRLCQEQRQVTQVAATAVAVNRRFSDALENGDAYFRC